MFFQSSTKRAGSLLASVLFFILAFISYTIFVRPEVGFITDLRGELRSKTELLEQQKTVSNEVGSLLNRFKSVKNLEDIVSMAIPVDENFGTLVNEFNILSKSSGLNIENINFQSLSLDRSRVQKRGAAAVEPLAGMGAVRMSLSLNGNYDSLKSFLGLLENNIRIINIQSLAISPASDQTLPKNSFKYKIDVNAYFQAKNEKQSKQP